VDDPTQIIRVLTVPFELYTKSRATQRGAPRALLAVLNYYFILPTFV
jgi:hypothetical protein